MNCMRKVLFECKIYADSEVIANENTRHKLTVSCLDIVVKTVGNVIIVVGFLSIR